MYKNEKFSSDPNIMQIVTAYYLLILGIYTYQKGEVQNFQWQTKEFAIINYEAYWLHVFRWFTLYKLA